MDAQCKLSHLLTSSGHFAKSRLVPTAIQSGLLRLNKQNSWKSEKRPYSDPYCADTTLHQIQQSPLCPLDGSKYTLTDGSLQSSLVAMEASAVTAGDYTFALLGDDKDSAEAAERRHIY